MNHRSLVAALAAVATLGASAATLDLKAESPPAAGFRVHPVSAPSQDRRTVIRGSTQFALDVYGRLRSEPGNVVFSPMSLSTVLAMAAEGAAGRTRAEIVSVLHAQMPRADRLRTFQSVLADLAPAADDGVRIDVVNGLWSDVSFRLRPSFVRRLERSFGARADELDFGEASDAARTINDWAREATQGLVPRVISADEIRGQTALVLANAVHFVGAWEHKFHEREDGWFFAPDGAVTAPLMSETEYFPAAFLDDVQVAELPYLGGDYAMLVLLPKASTSLAELEASLTPERLSELVAALEPDLLDLTFPAFAFESHLDLSDDLKALGLTAAFGDRADFSRAAKRGMRLSVVAQSASVRVDEEGTVAAAVTTGGFLGSGQSVGDPPRRFRVDHPFLFAIRHRPTGALLFLGRVEDPTRDE